MSATGHIKDDDFFDRLDCLGICIDKISQIMIVDNCFIDMENVLPDDDPLLSEALWCRIE